MHQDGKSREERGVSRDPAWYRHAERYRVRFSDLDTYRHVNNKAFLGYVEDARVRYLVEVGGFDQHYQGEGGIMVVHVSIDYVSQINFFEEVRVLTRCSRLGNRSFTLHHLVLAGPEAPDRPAGDATNRADQVDRPAGDSPGRVAATATTVFASVDMTAGRSRPNDPEMVARIREYEPRLQ